MSDEKTIKVIALKPGQYRDMAIDRQAINPADWINKPFRESNDDDAEIIGECVDAWMEGDDLVVEVRIDHPEIYDKRLIERYENVGISFKVEEEFDAVITKATATKIELVRKPE